MTTLLANDALELVWGTWLTTLRRMGVANYNSHLVYRTVLAHELEWHDLFCSGEWSWCDVKAAIEDALCS